LLGTLDYDSKGVKLIENSPEEIRNVALEFVDRLEGKWHAHLDDELLQNLFWKIFPTNAADSHRGMPLQGKIRARFSAKLLGENRG
jgi:hypothetical protein